MDKKTKEMLVKMAGQPDHLRKDKFIRECRKYNEESNKNTRNNKNNIMNRDNWNNKNNENNKLTTNNENHITLYHVSIFLYQLVCVVCFSVCFNRCNFHNCDENRSHGFNYGNRCNYSICCNGSSHGIVSIKVFWNVGTGKCHQSFVSGNLLCKNELHRNGTYCNYIMFDYLDWKK